MQTVDMFSDAIKEIADGKRLGSYDALTEALMRRLSEKGITLEQLTSRKMMNRSRRTLEGKCREFEIKFPDYVPVKMRPDGWRKKIKTPTE